MVPGMNDETQVPRGPLLLTAIERQARHAERRLRTQRALAWAAKAVATGLVAAAVILVLRKTGLASERVGRIGLLLAAAQVVVVAAVAYTRALPRRAGAVALDRFHGLADRLSSALSFGELPGAERTPFMLAAIDDAVAHAGKVDPKRAVPMAVPPEWPFLLLLVGGVAAISLFEIRKHQPIYSAKTIDAVDVTADDLDAMREFLREIDQRMQTDEAKAATQEFNQLIEDLANKRLDRTEAFRKMQQLEDKLMQGREADAKALEEALKKMGEELKKSELTKPAGEALENKNLTDAEKAMHDLAKKLREGGKGVDKAQLEKMREALKKAGEDQAKRAEALNNKREELKQDLLKQKQKQGDAGQNEQEKSLLQKKERELERLDRESEQQQKTQRELDRLDRELQKAAEDLMKDMGMSAQDLDNAAQDINRMAKQEMTQEEKEQLRQKLQELREMMRQQSQGGQGQMSRLRMFQQKAQGKGGQQGQGQGQGGQQGQGQEGEGQEGQGQQGQGQGQQAGGSSPGQGQGQGQGQGKGQGQGQGGGETWILGPNGEKILMISASKGQGGQGGQPGGQGGQGQKGPGWGTGHDNNVQGGATNPKVGVQDTQVQGNDTGQGGSRSEVILGAAERGFASRGYQKVYREYHTVAEEALNKDEIPGGYRFYVRRYFQLIRPREEGGGA
ncbi:MAG: Endoglucanase, partial [Labilithrix sp.]|nr:Endoglucanase [Labilithrix sp.]